MTWLHELLPWCGRVARARQDMADRLQTAVDDAVRLVQEREQEDEQDRTIQQQRDLMYEQVEERSRRIGEALASFKQGVLTRDRHSAR